MTTVTGAQVADSFLRDIGAPTTPGNVRAVSIWLAFENSTILRNNPWNIKGTGTCGSDGTFAIYCSLDDGIAATAGLVKSRSYYQPMVAALQRSDPLGFLKALIVSPWDGAHYGGLSATNKLLVAFSGTFNYAAQAHPVSPIGSSAGSGSSSSGSPGGSSDSRGSGAIISASTLNDFLTSIGRTVNDPIRQQDVEPFVSYLMAQGILPNPVKASNPLDALSATFADNVVRDALTKEIQAGKTWATIGSDLTNMATQTTDPITLLADAATNLVGFVGKLFDPSTWVALLAFGIGLGMILWGANRVLGATGGPSVSVRRG